jgi:hypothetical protein
MEHDEEIFRRQVEIFNIPRNAKYIIQCYAEEQK